MAYRGSNREKVSQITGIGELEALTRRKRLRWAARIYGKHEPELRPRAERILREELGDEVILTWPEGEEWSPGCEVSVRDRRDGMEGLAAGATAEGGVFLGELATVMDGELIGIAGAW